MLTHAAEPIKRDRVVLNTFLAADDALQGIIALHLFTNALYQNLEASHEARNSNRVVALRITHDWARNIRVGQIVSSMSDGFEFVYCRLMLLAIVANFETAVRNFKRRLWDCGALGSKGQTYRQPDYRPLLSWAFQVVRNTPCGDDNMRNRLPDVCGDLDNARRLRNLSLHNNYKYNAGYVSDGIREQGVTFRQQKEYSPACNGTRVFLTNADIENFCYSHIELLHMLHNTIQRKYFGCLEEYNYDKEGKQPELHRLISGRYDVEF